MASTSTGDLRGLHRRRGQTLCDHEVRRIPIGQFVLYFTIVDEARAIWVIHARHGKQLTESDAFPTDLNVLEEVDDDLDA